MQRSLLVFESAIKTEATRQAYLYQLKRFMKWSSAGNPDSLLRISDSELQIKIEDYLFYKKKLVSPNTIPMIFNPLELFFSMNDKKLEWKKIRKMFPGKVKKSGYGAWSHEDTRRIIDAAKGPRNKALVHVLASTGCRIGVIPDLKLKNVTEMPDGCKAILFYEGYNEEYYGFLTPESSTALDEYLERRRQDGEKFEPDSPLFRLEYRIKNAKPKPFNLVALKATMTNLTKYSRVKRQKVGTRYNIQLDHGFRKRFATVIKLERKISWAVSERLLGHKKYLDQEYFDPSIENLFLEFKKVIPALTISDEERQKMKITNLESKEKDAENWNKMTEKIAKRSDDQDKVIKMLVTKLQDLENKYIETITKDEKE